MREEREMSGLGCVALKIKRGPDCSGPLLQVCLDSGGLTPAEEPFPAKAVFQSRHAQERKNAGVADQGVRSNEGTERKQDGGASDEAGEDRKDDELFIHVGSYVGSPN